MDKDLGGDFTNVLPVGWKQLAAKLSDLFMCLPHWEFGEVAFLRATG